jgi:hypothetical protein
MSIAQRLLKLERKVCKRLTDCRHCFGMGPVHTFFRRPTWWAQSRLKFSWEDGPGRRYLTGDEEPHEPACHVCGGEAFHIIITTPLISGEEEAL